MTIRSRLTMAGALLALSAGWATVGHAYAAPARSAVHALKKTVFVKETNNKYHFTPAKATVKVGTTVTWTNKTDIHHNVTFNNGPKVNKDFNPGKSVNFHFTKTGTYQYHCEYHPYMHGTVTVTH